MENNSNYRTLSIIQIVTIVLLILILIMQLLPLLGIGGAKTCIMSPNSSSSNSPISSGGSCPQSGYAPSTLAHTTLISPSFMAIPPAIA